MSNTRTVEFSGEESARFARFAQIALNAGVRLSACVQGREPLISRNVRLEGVIEDAVLDGYMRLVYLREQASNLIYWVAGSNATRSIAAHSVAFIVASEDAKRIVSWAEQAGQVVPGLAHEHTGIDAKWLRLDESPRQQSTANLEFLLDELQSPDTEFKRDVALTLRAFASMATKRRSLQSKTEEVLLSVLPTTIDNDTRIAIIEDLGYVGTERSVPVLSSILTNETEHDHARWAAAIALGRLPGAEVVDALIQGLAGNHAWTKAAALLGLSRRSGDDTPDLEDIFRSYLTLTTDERFQRYACLGLSRFSSLRPETVSRLADMLGDFSLGPEVKGYVALALSSALGSCDDDIRHRLGRLISSLGEQPVAADADPEAIWGQEFLAELASLLELHRTAARLHKSLADLFDDWRGHYYRAVALYEEADASIKNDDVEGSLELFSSALSELRGINLEDPDARQTVAFRTDIIDARIALQQSLRDWFEASDPEVLKRIPGELRNTSRIYARYAQPVSKSVEGIKRLSDRERQYLSGTRRLLEIIAAIVSLDGALRAGPVGMETVRIAIDNVLETIERLTNTSAPPAAKGLTQLAIETLSRFREISIVVGDADIPAIDRERSVRALMTELRGLFRTATWPMPARACPIGGLGRGTLSVLGEEIPGRGIESDPFRYPVGSPAVLNVVAEITEMAPGGATQVVVGCRVGEVQLVQPIHAVEGPARCTFVLPDVLSPVASTVCHLELRFEARDCQQLAARHVVYLRRGG